MGKLHQTLGQNLGFYYFVLYNNIIAGGKQTFLHSMSDTSFMMLIALINDIYQYFEDWFPIGRIFQISDNTT